MSDRLRGPSRSHRSARAHADACAAVLGLGVLSVMQLRGHALTYPAGGPAIAILTGVLPLPAALDDEVAT